MSVAIHPEQPSSLVAQPGYYTDSILKLRLTFPPEYPERAPTVHFITDIFHPLVSQQDGAFNLGAKFRPWRSVPGPRSRV